jgi:hypothetical protein
MAWRAPRPLRKGCEDVRFGRWGLSSRTASRGQDGGSRSRDRDMEDRSAICRSTPSSCEPGRSFNRLSRSSHPRVACSNFHGRASSHSSPHETRTGLSSRALRHSSGRHGRMTGMSRSPRPAAQPCLISSSSPRFSPGRNRSGATWIQTPTQKMSPGRLPQDCSSCSSATPARPQGSRGKRFVAGRKPHAYRFESSRRASPCGVCRRSPSSSRCLGFEQGIGGEHPWPSSFPR